MAPSRVAGGLAHSSSDKLCQGDVFIGNPQLGPTNIGNISSNVASPVPSIGANSMITNANSQLSFPSNNVSVSGSSVIDRQNLNNTPNNVMHLQKKPRLDTKEEEIIMQHIFQRQKSLLPSRNQNPQLQELIQQQQFLQSITPAQRAHILQQQRRRQQIQSISSRTRPQDNGICSRRIMKYLYHLRQHPPENSISYWRKFVVEYFSPRAKKRWCFSSYNSVGNQSLEIFPQANMDAWHCDICGSKTGKGFEASCEVLARLNEIKYASGVVAELLFLDLPRETTFPSGIMMLEYGKAVEECVYEQLRVVREGHLRIIFSPDLKILSWEFCARRHEELLRRRVVAPQVNQLVQIAQKCQSTITESGAEGICRQDLQRNSNMVVTAGRQLAKTFELQSLNDLGFSKRYVRCLQIAEVVGSMKSLMDFCRDQKGGPIEGLKTYHQQVNSKMQMQQRDDVAQPANIRGLPTDRDTLNKYVNNQMNNTMVGRGGFNGSAQDAPALTNFENMVTRQNFMNSNYSVQNSSLIFQKPISITSTNMKGPPFFGGFTSPQHQQVSNANQGERQKASSYGDVANHNVVGSTQSRSNEFKDASDSKFSLANSVNRVDPKAPDLPRNNPLSEDVVKDIADEFIENGFFSSDFNDMDFDWKM